MFSSDAEIIALGEAFLACSLPKPAWTHAAHFATALYLISCRPDLPARARMPGLIRIYNESVGGVNSPTAGYHETITLASLAAAADHAGRHPAAALHVLVNTLLAGPCGDKDWLLAYWSRDLLFGTLARATWVPPDLAPLPFPV
jgi:hypothetical protein